MGKALGRESLDHMGCSDPECTGKHSDPVMYFHGRCHPAADLSVAYHRDHGHLCFWCGECGEVVGFVAVAEKDFLYEKKDMVEVNREQD
jgi:hypothetical protein